MNAISFSIPQKSDKSLVALLQELVGANPTLKPTVFNYSLLSGGSAGIPFGSIQADEKLKQILQLDGDVITRMELTGPHPYFLGNIVLAIDRRPSTSADQFTLSPGQQFTDETLLLNLASRARAKFGAFDPKRVFGEALTAEQERYYAARETALSKLEEINASLIRGTDEYRKQRDAEFDQQSKALAKEHEKKQEELSRQFKAKAEELEKERTDFEAKKKKFDDREATHVRRQIRSDIKEEFKSRAQTFKLTEGTQKLREPVNRLCVILMLFFGLVAGSYVYFGIQAIVAGTVATTAQLISLTVKQVVWTAAFGATSVFFVKWLNQWFQQHAKEEFRMKRLELDMDRAAWVVEMALEWKSEKGTEIPSDLLNRLTRNLFVEDEIEFAEYDPKKQIANMLLGASASVKLKTPGGAELNIDKKGAQSLAKEGV